MLKVLAMRAKNKMMAREDGQTRITVINRDDEAFVEKVRMMLENEEVNSCPLKSLMDAKMVGSLNESAKEKYLLDITEKYLKAKEQIESEKLRSMAF